MLLTKQEGYQTVMVHELAELPAAYRLKIDEYVAAWVFPASVTSCLRDVPPHARKRVVYLSVGVRNGPSGSGGSGLSHLVLDNGRPGQLVNMGLIDGPYSMAQPRSLIELITDLADRRPLYIVNEKFGNPALQRWKVTVTYHYHSKELNLVLNERGKIITLHAGDEAGLIAWKADWKRIFRAEGDDPDKEHGVAQSWW